LKELALARFCCLLKIFSSILLRIIVDSFLYCICLLLFPTYSHELRGKDSAGRSGPLPIADPDICNEYEDSEGVSRTASGLDIDQKCFDLPPADLANTCLNYLGGEASICYVRAEKMILDSRNVVYWNALRETDIVMLNTGLHHNTRYVVCTSRAGSIHLFCFCFFLSSSISSLSRYAC